MIDYAYFRSLSQELQSLKDRVRSFIDDNHWLTDGEWKESVLRSFLRRHLPKSVQVGRGFIITDDTPSRQIDVLIYDSAKPILFQDGDLVCITPDAVLGIVEVKTSLNQYSYRIALRKLCSNIELVERRSIGKRVYGLFSYGYDAGDTDRILPILQKIVGGQSKRVVNCICLGESIFIRYWHLDPHNQHQMINAWHAYSLQNTAAGYFIHNIIQGICPESVEENRRLWFPVEGKEGRMIGEMKLKSA